MKAKFFWVLLTCALVQCKSQQQNGADRLTLENTYWRLVEVDGTPVITPPDGRDVYMTLVREDDVRRLKGHAGCNGLGGEYEVDGNTIRFAPITTRMYCNTQMQVENAFIKMLTVATRYRVEGRSLHLLAGDQLLGKFEAGDGG